MRMILVLLATVLVLMATAGYVARRRARGALTAKSFALAVAVGWASAIAVFYFAGLGLASEIELTPELVRLGLGIVLLNLILGYPTSVFAYRRILTKVFSEGKAPLDSS